ncbi:MAG TPA: PAS domain-containing sensor histidine kinase [Gammaproteobacteria bacterium]|nr:PAS domain-containing sensor histidine kinase [Gammaproteobacteria bacterium]
MIMPKPDPEKIPSNVLFVLLLLVLTLPFLSAIYLLDAQLGAQSEFIERQKTGIDYIRILRNVLEHVQQHRGMGHARRNGEHEFDLRLFELGDDLDQEIQELENRYNQLGIIPETSRKNMRWYEQWLNLQKHQVAMTAEDDFDAHSILISEYLGSIQDIADAFGLTLETDLKTRYLMEGLIQLPVQIENIARMRGLGTGSVARSQVDSIEKKKLLSLGQLVSSEMDSLVRNMNRLFRHDASLEFRMAPILAQGINKSSQFLMMTYQNLIESDAPAVSATIYFSAGSAALDGFLNLFDAIQQELGAVLAEQLADIHYKRILLWLSSLLAMAAIATIYYMFLRQQKTRQRLWRELQQEEERLDLIMHGTQDGIWDWDFRHDRIYFSPRWKNMLGYDEHEIVDHFSSIQELLHPDDLGEALAAWYECMDGGKDTFEVEYRMKTREGGYCWIQARGLTLLDKEGNPVRMAGAHTDISKHKQAFAELQSINRELEQFAYVTSHDLKAPLRAIANLSQWIEEDLQAVMSDDTRKHMLLLRGRVKRMEALINGILQYSRAGRVDMEIETVDVAELLAEILDGLDYPDDFRIDVLSQMPVFETARLPLSQVFANLISNAIKYHEGSGGRVLISMQEKGEYYEFSVADNGPGIASEYHEKVFEIFQTLQARDKQESTGVGLTLVKKIIEELGGEVMLESAEGEGATFRFTILKRLSASLVVDEILRSKTE